MAKGQKRSNREVRKPKTATGKKAAPVLSAVSSAMVKPSKFEAKAKRK